VRTSIRFSLLTMFAGFGLLVGACSSDSVPPEGIAFQDDSSGDTVPAEPDGGQAQPEDSTTTTVAPTTTAAPTTTEAPEPTTPRVNRPNRTCSTSDYSVAFDASVVLQDPATTVAGPYTINVPAGTYEITMSSWLGFEDDPAQTMEQWYFTTDSGYTSPLTTDASPELIWTDAFGSQTLGDTTTVTLRHKAPGGASANSTHPLCIGFRTVAAPTTTTAAPTTTTTAAPTTTTTQATAIAPASTAAPTTTTTAAPTTTTQVVATAPAELALTGPRELSMSLGLTGAALMLAGVATVTAARRSEED
jgi:hypothetical protein